VNRTCDYINASSAPFKGSTYSLFPKIFSEELITAASAVLTAQLLKLTAQPGRCFAQLRMLIAQPNGLFSQFPRLIAKLAGLTAQFLKLAAQLAELTAQFSKLKSGKFHQFKTITSKFN
jgi:hypothetical protein